jgi:shikimate kinase
MPLALIGFRGTGKSTIARRLSDRLQLPWFDADVELERRAEKTIREIFADEGEGGFRDREEHVLAELTAQGDVILALGGGVILREANRQLIREADVVWLTAPAAVIAERLAADPTTSGRRPQLTSSGGLPEIESLLADREPLYHECADITVSTKDKTPEQIADEIVCLLGR